MQGSPLYQRPDLYDLEYQDQTQDVAHYLALAGRTGGPVLELGCGNGRMTLPLARAGHRVVGVDLAAPMLADLHRKLAEEPAQVQALVHTHRRSFLALDELGSFPLVMLPFNALHHCPTHKEVLTLGNQVRSVLAPGGTFALDTYLPSPTLYQRDPSARYAERVTLHPLTGRALRSWESSWYDPRTQVHHITYTYSDPLSGEFEVSLDLRMFYPQELKALVELAGFWVVREHGGFDGEPLTGTSLKWVAELSAL